MAIEGNNTIEVKEYLAKAEKLSNQIAELRYAITKVMDRLNRNGSSGTNTISQSNETLNWLKNNVDEFWNDMNGSIKQQVLSRYEKLCSQDKSPIYQVTSVATQIVDEANEKLEALMSELRENTSKLESIYGENVVLNNGVGEHPTNEQTYKLN